MALFRMNSEGGYDAFFDAMSFGELDQLESPLEDPSLESVENIDEHVSNKVEEIVVPPPPFLSMSDNIPSPDRAAGIKTFELKPNDLTPTITNLKQTTPLSAFTAVKTNTNITETKEERSIHCSQDSLSSLLSQSEGKFTLTSNVDPLSPPKECPLKLPVKNSSFFSKSFTQRSSAMSPLSFNSNSSTSKSSINSSSIFNRNFRKNRPKLSQTLSDPILTRDYFDRNLSFKRIPHDEFKSDKEAKKYYDDKVGVNKYRFQVLNKDTEEVIDMGERSQQTFAPFRNEPNLILRSSNCKESFSPDSTRSEEIAVDRTLSPMSDMNNLSESDDIKPKKKYALSLDRLKKSKKTKKIKKTEKSVHAANCKRIPISDLPANSVPIKSSRRRSRADKKRGALDLQSNPMLLLQTLQNAHDGPIWCCDFSPDGKYYATGGEDNIIRIWETQSTTKNENEEESTNSSREIPTTPLQKTPRDNEDNVDKHAPTMVGEGFTTGNEINLLSSTPIQTFSGHTGDIIDISWSTSPNSKHFLLSASVDKTVKLWHISRPQPLLTFKHSDLVTSVHFHPHDENYFLSVGFDKKIRLWNIPKERVCEWANAPEIITRGRFSPDGRFIVAGLINGFVLFYSCRIKSEVNSSSYGASIGKGQQGLRYYTQLACKNRHGIEKAGKKITGLEFVNYKGPHGLQKGETLSDNNETHMEFSKKKKSRHRGFNYQLLVSTNDSRMRLYGMDDFTLIRKYKGLVNNNSMIKAHFCETGNQVICGSEIGNVYIWNTDPKEKQNVNSPRSDTGSTSKAKTGKNIYERNQIYKYFEAISSKNLDTSVVTDAQFVPSTLVQNAFLSSGLFPTLKRMDNLDCNFSSSMVVSSDSEGTIRIFLRKSCLDRVYLAAGPDGNPEDHF